MIEDVSNLKNAAEEIRAIINKYDIAGVVVLHTPGEAFHFMELSPSYSCCKIDSEKRTATIHANKKDFIDTAIYHKCLLNTSDMLWGLAETTKTKLMNNLAALSRMLDEKAGKIEHGVVD